MYLKSSSVHVSFMLELVFLAFFVHFFAVTNVLRLEMQI